MQCPSLSAVGGPPSGGQDDSVRKRPAGASRRAAGAQPFSANALHPPPPLRGYGEASPRTFAPSHPRTFAPSHPRTFAPSHLRTLAPRTRLRRFAATARQALAPLGDNRDVPLRVRFAPSPTGYLHVGGARTALFNWLYARRHGGTFVLRIEDTDEERSSADMVTGILDGLRWLGLTWDEGPDIGGPMGPTSSRNVSTATARRRSGCWQTVTRTTAIVRPTGCVRSASAPRRAVRRGSTTARVCAFSPDRIRELEASGAARAVRFKVPEGRTTFDDAVHGRIEFDGANIEDFVVPRSDGRPTYHLSVVVDDMDMAITHVIRGDDHISNTPKHVLLFEALGAPAPQFAHVPLILGAGQEASEQASRRHLGDGVPASGVPSRRDGELPGAARMVARRRPRADVDRRSGRRSRSRGSAAAMRSSIPRNSIG